MILGVGIDVVHPQRLRRWQQIPGLLERFYHPEELAQCRKRAGEAAVLSLAARFAAKEAFGKALGSGLAGLALKDMAVMNNPLGKPELQLTGSAKAALQRLGGTRVFISLSHEKTAVLAMCVIEGDSTAPAAAGA
ncbi:MAG: holo-ACP synthase [Spirochaetaceae bacterium]|nr:holo-ACP synthase [Spirochaetaceae bacterium]